MNTTINEHLAHQLHVVTDQLRIARDKTYHYRQVWRDAHQEIRKLKEKIAWLKAAQKFRRNVLEGRLKLLYEENKDLRDQLAALEALSTSASEENERLNDENERLRLRNYELKRELEEVYRKLWETEIERASKRIFSHYHNHHKNNTRAFPSLPFALCPLPTTHPHTIEPCTIQKKKIPFAVTMEAAVEKQNDLINLLHENKIALSEAKAAAAQSAATITKIIDENMQLKHEVERLQAENKELRLKLWDATEEERMMDAGRLGEVLKVL
ncbi:hypothetical protein D6D12_09737 [Aureobasidium pullulans]|uniref:Autophagy-related protein 16 domain-containing protein n=1 Tax=Aureobasidium pullulans TaxID=5580 RepID=A0AB74JF77_AURPU|nr:hypothetical protein D6D12_09737 [Aureobasidium pullulans]THX43531.1 hypothetical protein D6D11_08060 [Aureobasidium pullulans]